MRKTTSVALTLIALAAPLTADELRIELDPELTSISFRLQATLHSVHGSAALVAGSLRLNTESGAMAGAVTIDATAAETGNKKRDKKMHGKVLLTADHPEIVLRAQRLEGELAQQGASDVTLHGEIEILGRTHQIGIPSHVEIDGGRFTASLEFEIPYVDWGLKDPSTFVLRVAKAVEITVSAKGTVGDADKPREP
jgi:polyisoprenoid-binding protein YceI